MSEVHRTHRFAGRKIYLTGAASGIGLATAHVLAAGGAELALVDVDAAGLERTVAACGGHALPLDLADGDAVEGSVRTAADLLGGLDGVVNCAGISQSGRLETIAPATWERVLAINLTAPFRICRAALPYLRQRPGSSIVNVASGTALLPSSPGATAYVASKGGLVSFSKALAAELGPDIRVNVVCPGIVETPMTAAVLAGDAAVFLGQYALKRAAAAAEIAEAIAFLLSAEASFITGTTLAVDGGRTFH